MLIFVLVEIDLCGWFSRVTLSFMIIYPFYSRIVHVNSVCSSYSVNKQDMPTLCIHSFDPVAEYVPIFVDSSGLASASSFGGSVLGSRMGE